MGACSLSGRAGVAERAGKKGGRAVARLPHLPRGRLLCSVARRTRK